MRAASTFGLVLILVLGAGMPARGQTPVTLTIEEAVTRGLAASPRLAESRAREAAAEAAATGRLALGRPSLTAMSSVLRTNHVDEFGIPQADGRLRVIFPDIPNNYRTRAELALPLYTAGRVGSLVEAARAERRAAVAETRAATADVELEITVAYWNLVIARERATVLERALERADAGVSDVRARVETGVLPPNEVLSAQAQRARQNVQLIQSRNEAAVAEAQLGRLVGIPPGAPIVTASDVSQPTPGAAAFASQAAPSLVARALDARAERAALVAREAALHEAGAASRAATRPQVAALAAIEPARPNPRFVPRVDTWNTSWDLAVNVSWAVWDGGRARAEAAVTSAQADALRARIADFDAGVAVEVRQRLADIASASAALQASTEAVGAATEAARVLRERFDVGVATSTELLDANVALVEAELERTRLSAALRLGEARLVRTAGGSTR